MKRLFSIAAMVAALAFSPPVFASADMVTIDDSIPILMSQTSDFVAADPIVADAVDNTLLIDSFSAGPALIVAFDSSYHPSCRGEAKAAHAAFCAEIEAGPLVPGDVSGPDECNPHSPRYRGEDFCGDD